MSMPVTPLIKPEFCWKRLNSKKIYRTIRIKIPIYPIVTSLTQFFSLFVSRICSFVAKNENFELIDLFHYCILVCTS